MVGDEELTLQERYDLLVECHDEHYQSMLRLMKEVLAYDAAFYVLKCRAAGRGHVKREMIEQLYKDVRAKVDGEVDG
jgi:hypothetical protein